mgnify:CR=1 FL=1
MDEVGLGRILIQVQIGRCETALFIGQRQQLPPESWVPHKSYDLTPDELERNSRKRDGDVHE